MALNRGDSTFASPQFVLPNFGYEDGWRLDRHVRLAVDLGRGQADIVAFGDDGVWLAPSRGDGTFDRPRLIIEQFGYNAPSWRVDEHPRFLADVRGSGYLDVIGFFNDGVWMTRGPLL